MWSSCRLTVGGRELLSYRRIADTKVALRILRFLPFHAAGFLVTQVRHTGSKSPVPASKVPPKHILTGPTTESSEDKDTAAVWSDTKSVPTIMCDPQSSLPSWHLHVHTLDHQQPDPEQHANLP